MSRALFGRIATNLDASARRGQKRARGSYDGKNDGWVLRRVRAVTVRDDRSTLSMEREGCRKEESEAEKQERFLHGVLFWESIGAPIQSQRTLGLAP